MSPKPWTLRAAALAVVLATSALMIATEPNLAIVWDEGYTLGREARLRLWFRALADPPGFASQWQPPSEELVQQVGALPPSPGQIDTRAKLLFDPNVLGWFWPFAREEPHGHPPFYALIGLIGDVLTPGRPDLARARLGPMLVFSLTAGALFLFVARRWGNWPGTLSAVAWVFQPNLFGHGHYATYDALLSALWLNAILAFSSAVEVQPNETVHRRMRWDQMAVFGLLLGFAADTKLTGWFLPIPFLVWVGIYRSKRGLFALLVGGAIAIVTLYLLNPPWWTEPVAGLTRFFASNLNRGQTIRIKTLFLGQVYSTPDGSLPWYNTLAWTVFVTPVGFLALALIGLGRALRRWRTESVGLLAVGHWAFLLLLRALPHTPGHDGVRQFLPAFGVLALVAGLGAASVVVRFQRTGKLLLAAALAEGVVSVGFIMPVPLSYYSPVVGNLPGASTLGMEPTYYWDSLTDESLDWLSRHTGAGEKVRFASFPTAWLYLRSQNRLPDGLLPSDRGTWKWYVLQNRPGSFSSIDRALIERGEPAFVFQKWGVPLLWIFPYSQVEALLGIGGRGRETNRPTTTRPGRAAVGRDRFVAIGRDRDELHALAGSLRRSLGSGVDRRGGRGFANDRGGFASNLLLVAEAALEELDAAEAALLPRDGLAHRGRGRTRLDHDARGRLGALLLVASLGVGRSQGTEEPEKGQGQKVTTHVALSKSSNVFQSTQADATCESGQNIGPARSLRVMDIREFAKSFLRKQAAYEPIIQAI